MKRGEIWTVAGGSDYAGKPRPAVIVQTDIIADLGSIIICPITSDTMVEGVSRILIEITPGNGLREASCVMVDKVAALPLTKMGRRIGQLENVYMRQVDQALMIVLGLAGGKGNA